MPLYEYECFVCGHRFERIQRFSDPPASECPACGGAVRRLLGVPALQFKGSGGGTRPPSPTAEESSSTSPESTPPPKPDAAPAAAPEPKGGTKRKKKPS